MDSTRENTRLPDDETKSFHWNSAGDRYCDIDLASDRTISLKYLYAPRIAGSEQSLSINQHLIAAGIFQQKSSELGELNK